MNRSGVRGSEVWGAEEYAGGVWGRSEREGVELGGAGLTCPRESSRNSCQERVSSFFELGS